MAIRIREYRSSDRELVLFLAVRFSEFEIPEWRTKEALDHANRSLLEQALNQLESGSAIFMAEEDGTLAGFIHLQTQTDYFSGEEHGYIADLAVDKRFEGRGIGRLLLERAEDWTRANGYRLLTLYVFSGNARARQVYEKHGFHPEVIKYVKPIE